MKPPTFILPQPEPKLELKRFHGRPLQVWVGETKESSVYGWVDNPRIQHQVNKFRKENARPPDDAEILQMMLADKKQYEIREIADDIRKNLVRVPIVLSYSGKLLDGNRRLFATRFLLGSKVEPGLKADLERIPCWVLTKDATAEDEHNVVVHENFNPSLKKDWERYLKARKVKDDQDDGLSLEEIEEKYGWKKGRIRSEIGAMVLCEIFMAQYKDALTDFGAEEKAIEFFTYFEQAHTTFRDAVTQDPNFQQWLFRVLMDGRHGDNLTNVRKLHSIYVDKEARDALMDPQRDPKDAILDAIHIMQENAGLVKTGGSLGKAERFAEWLDAIKVKDLDTINPASYDKLLDAVHSRSAQVSDLDPNRPIARFTEWAEKVAIKQVDQLDQKLVQKLRQAVERLSRQSGK